jgi:hypothetical protein
LTFLFGSLGLFYTGVVMAMVFTVVGLVVIIAKLGIGIILVWPLSMIVGAVSASNHHAYYQRWLATQGPWVPYPPPPPSQTVEVEQ